MIGTKIEHYEIRAELGRGAMGVVYRAHDHRIRRDVALKFLPLDFAADPERLQRFQREARVVGALNHPNILTLFDVGTHEGAPYLVTELLEGQTLRQHLGAPMAVPRAVDFGLQIARGLAAAHARGIVHRDLKPENLFVTRDGRVKILDFGLAKPVIPENMAAEEQSTATRGLATESGVLLGTALYMSPEQAHGKPATAVSDLFALGVILFEMLAGARPFAGEGLVEVLHAILKEEPPLLRHRRPEVPALLERTVRHCLEKAPESRCQSAHDLAFELELVAYASDTKAASGAATKAAWGRRSLWLAAAVFVAGGGLGALLVSMRTPPQSIPGLQRLTFRRGVVSAARFAPDGRTIVYSAAWDGEPMRVYTTRLESPASSPLLADSTDLLSISHSGELAITTESRLDFDSQSWTGTLARVPLGGGTPRALQEGVRQGTWAPDGKNLAVVRQVGRRFRLEYPVGTVLYENVSGYVTHPDFSPDGELIGFIDHEHGADDRGYIAVVDRNGTVRRLTDAWGSAAGLAWSADGQEIWFTAARSGTVRDLHAVTLSGEVRLVFRMAAPLVLQDIFADGRILLARTLQEDGLRGLPPGATRERHLSWLDYSAPTDLSQDGQLLLFGEYSEGAGAEYAACLRRTDGSPVVRLGDGKPYALSPDGDWALVADATGRRLSLIPTGVGASRTLAPGAIANYWWASWFPSGDRIVVAGAEAGHEYRLYVQDLERGLPRPISPEGTYLFWPGAAVSPDGRFVLGTDFERHVSLYPVNGGEPQRIAGLQGGDVVVSWTTDRRSLLFYKMFALPQKIYRLHLDSGHVEVVREISPPDPAGILYIGGIDMSADERSYVYGYRRNLSDLYLVEGLR